MMEPAERNSEVELVSPTPTAPAEINLEVESVSPTPTAPAEINLEVESVSPTPTAPAEINLEVESVSPTPTTPSEDNLVVESVSQTPTARAEHKIDVTEPVEISVTEPSVSAGMPEADHQSTLEEGTVMSFTELITKFKSLYKEHIGLPKSELVSKLMKRTYMLACIVSVCVDPFFFYIPMVSKDSKCISLHQSVKITTITLRSTLDLLCLAFTLLIAYQKKVGRPTSTTNDQAPLISLTNLCDSLSFNWNNNRMGVIRGGANLYAVLPIPQIIFIPKLLDFSSSGRTKLLSFLALVQYVPRVLRIYLSCGEYNPTPYRENGIWIYFKGGFSLFLYILCGHAIGSFWYFLAIQREATCWKDACLSESSCEPTTFTTLCVDNPRTRNTTFLNDFCSINEGKATSFHFGMFLHASQDGVLESTNLGKKFCYCLWWGLRNLSSLAQNLTTSIYTWENIYAIFISICGLLLVLLYLTSNLKAGMQLVNKSSTKKRVMRQLRVKDQEVQVWLKEHDLPTDIKTEIMDHVQRQLEQNLDVYVENILNILPLECKTLLKGYIYMASLKEVPVFQDWPKKVMEALIEIVKPVSYNENSNIIGEGEPHVMMLYITEGIILKYPSTNAGTSSASSSYIQSTPHQAETSGGSSSKIQSLEKGGFHGEKLVSWATECLPFSDLPFSESNVKSFSKVEALALTANDLKKVVARFPGYFSNQRPTIEEKGKEIQIASAS